MNMCKMLSGLDELPVTAIVIMKMQERVDYITLIADWKMILEYELNTCQNCMVILTDDVTTIYNNYAAMSSTHFSIMGDKILSPLIIHFVVKNIAHIFPKVLKF